MTSNMTNMQQAKVLFGKMMEQVRLYEKGTVGDPLIVEVELTANQVTALKQSFVTNRTALFSLLNSVTG